MDFSNLNGYKVKDAEAREKVNKLYGENTNAFGKHSVAFGRNTIAGLKGFYIKSVDLDNKKIYLCREKVLPIFSSDDNTDTTFETPAYEADDNFTIINSSHYMYDATIASVSNNVVTYNGDLGFTEWVEDADVHGHTFSVPSKPAIGCVSISLTSFACGNDNIVAGRYAFACGNDNIAAGSSAFVSGSHNIAGYVAHAEGSNTKALGRWSHAEGMNTVSSGVLAHAEGAENEASGECSHVEGRKNIASGNFSHVEGYENEATSDASHAEGRKTKAMGIYSHTEGLSTKTEGFTAHAEGNSTQAIGEATHSEGHTTKAIGQAAHAEGIFTEAGGRASHVEGYDTIATGIYQHVEGRYNIEDTEDKYVHIVGNGTSDTARSNAHTLDWDGNAWFAGSVQATSMTLASPNGTLFMISVDDSGVLKTTKLED